MLSAGSGGQRCVRNGEVRLEGGDHEFEGRVQVCQNGEWEHICIFLRTIDWNENHAKVVCRSLGYSTESKPSICVY